MKFTTQRHSLYAMPIILKFRCDR